jgi:YD repeat-containing protein
MLLDQTGNKQFIFDAWNQLVQVRNASNQTLLESFAYDAQGRRIIENPGTARDLFFSAAWQVIEERVAGNAQDQYVWSPVYVDAMIEIAEVLRDEPENVGPRRPGGNTNARHGQCQTGDRKELDDRGHYLDSRFCQRVSGSRALGFRFRIPSVT